ncbi:MAG: NHLP bacteriocin export ABC transporter permease/ATPase subunit [Eubacteriales bacterium]|nr:NHLP bacteriocin export ABC transporter permease/ATPase subunit [Eubacteriales bacterium]
MGWFDEQIKERKRLDDEVFSDSFIQMISVVIGNKASLKLSDNSIKIKDSIDEILKFYHVKTRDIPSGLNDVNDQLEYLLRPYGIMRRSVELDKGWYRDAVGALLAQKKEDGSIVALIPTGLVGYSYLDVETGKRVRINRKNEGLFEKDALAFYKPFPMRKIGIPDLITYMMSMLSVSDIVLYALSVLIVTLVGMLIPKLNSVLFSSVLTSGSIKLLTGTSVFLICVTVSQLIFGAVRTLIEARISTKLNISVEAATMMRVLSLPASFFKNYSSGNLSSRISYIGSLCETIVSSMISAGLTSVFSLVNITLLFKYAPSLVVPAVVIILCTTLFSMCATFIKMNLLRREMDVSAKESGMSYALISGVQKIKLSGAEKRAFARWADTFSKGARLKYNPPFFMKIDSVISMAISLIGTIVLYYEAAISGISLSDYYAFMSAFGIISAAFTGLVGIASNVAAIRPSLEMAKPILDAEPEISEGKEVISKLSGGIEINNVSFRYDDSMPNVVDDMSFKIRPGQYVAIVGKTGCGKSTLLRLLLGFEKPQKGAIFYDGKDINSIDLKSLRRKIGVVMQDGKLFQGDLYSNITISAPWLTVDDAWEAAEMAGVADDIRRMPMGMNTLVSEGSGGISGGQRQRLMIARAIAPKPKILMFDEATSALDNITQKKVSESLDSLKCTRIVIAHRLSTIRNCDRIICLDGGHIIEDGTYDELIAKGGFFAELVERQRVNISEEKTE